MRCGPQILLLHGDRGMDLIPLGNQLFLTNTENCSGVFGSFSKELETRRTLTIYNVGWIILFLVMGRCMAATRAFIWLFTVSLLFSLVIFRVTDFVLDPLR